MRRIMLVQAVYPDFVMRRFSTTTGGGAAGRRSVAEGEVAGAGTRL
jgi:hypothetical protein